ncbi:MAG: hypothetical protein CNLJKLNK_00390 [Holosporales bacterium]
MVTKLFEIDYGYSCSIFKLKILEIFVYHFRKMMHFIKN